MPFGLVEKLQKPDLEPRNSRSKWLQRPARKQMGSLATLVSGILGILLRHYV